VLPRNQFRGPNHARQVVLKWRHGFYNTPRRQSAKMMSTIDYETSAVLKPEVG
jgi:hypothetical protein